jgi:hypothetical protein
MAPLLGDGTADRNSWQSSKRDLWDYLADQRVRIFAELLILAGLIAYGVLR